jgi:hypothetical protein
MLSKAKILFLAFLAMSIILTSCTDDEEEPEKVLPKAPTNLQATSLSDTEVMIRWTVSEDHEAEGFEGYKLSVIDETGNAVLSNQAINDYQAGGVVTVTGLTEGKIYDFTVVAVNGDGDSEPITIKWSPAIRLNQTVNEGEIRLYGSASQFGSGMRIYAEDDLFDARGPEILTIAQKAAWHFAFDDTNDMFRFGSADEVSIGANAANPEFPGQMSNAYNASSLNDVFDSQALNQSTFTNKLFTLSDSQYADYAGVVLAIRVPTAESGVYHYGKILIKKNPAGGFVFNSGTSDQYIDCVVSYQRTANVPYAKLGL